MMRRTETPDGELVRDTLGGSRSSFNALVDRYRDQVYRLAWFKVRRREEAEDLAQDAFIAAYQSLRQLREPERFAPWLRRVTENVCNIHLRRCRVELVPLEECRLSVDDVSGAVERRMLNARVHDALSRLSETNRLAATLFFVDGFSQKEIARFLDLPLTTIKRRINLSRAQLQKEMIDMMKDSIGPEKPKPEFTAKVAQRIDVMRWYEQFSEYVDAGVSLTNCLDKLSKGDFGEEIKKETLVVKEAIEQDKYLSYAIRDHAPSLNHPMAVGFIRAGEVGGILERGLRSIVDWMRREDIGLKIEASVWCRTLGSMLLAGVPIVQAVDTMKTVRAGGPFPELPDRISGKLRTPGGFTQVLAEYPDIFSPAVLALIRAGEPVCLDVALIRASAEMIREAYERLRSDPLATVSDAGRDDLVKGVREQLTDASPETRLGALQALDQLTGAESLSDFSAALSDPDAGVRETAIRILARHPSPELARPLAEATHHPSAGVRQTALSALLAADPERAAEEARAAVCDPDLGVRRAAILVLGSVNRPESAGLLVKALGDGELLVVWQAQEALANMGQTALAALLAAPFDPSTAERRLEVIVRLDPMEARKQALRILERETPELRPPALKALASVADPRDTAILTEALWDSDGWVAMRAAEALGRIQASSAVPALIQALARPEDWVAMRMEWALAAIGDTNAASDLVAALSENDQPHRRARILDLLRKLVGKRQTRNLLRQAVKNGRLGRDEGEKALKQTESWQ